jgi:tetratricopeptide (TPR) repeat protein
LWAFRRLLEAKSAERPLLLAIDDMHRAGEKTIELLAELMARVTEVPVMLVLAGRPDGEWLGHFPSASTVRVTPLGRGDATALANALVPERPLGPSAAAALVDRAGGNPLYVRELIAMVHHQGGLVADNGHYELAAGLALPPSLQAILAARLDALGTTEKTAVQHVAVLGNGATDAQVERLGLGEARRALRPLVAAGLLRQDRDGRYDVADPLLREVAYETLPRAVRADRHRQAAGVSTSVEDQARHLDRAVGYRPDDAALAEEAADALAAAGVQLLDDFRVIDGMRLLQRAVDLGYRAPIDLLRLARSYGELSRNDEALAVVDLVPVDTGDTTIDAERAHVHAWALQMRDPEATLVGLADAATRWAGLGNRQKEGWAHANLGVALFNMGRVAESQAALDTGLAIFQDVDHRPGVMAVYRFLALARPEDPRAADWLEEAFRDAEEKGDRNAQLSSLVSLAWHHFFRFRLGGPDRLDVIADLAAHAAELGQELGAPEFAGYGLCIGSNVARLRGRLDDAADLARRACRLRLDEAPSTACLARTVEFGARLAQGEAVAPPEPSSSTDPVASMAFVLQFEALLLAGREVHDLRRDRGNLEALQWLVGGIPSAWGRIRGGDHEGAVRIARVARGAAEAAGAEPVLAAATALEAEARVRAGEHEVGRRLLEPLGAPDGVAGLFVLRARAAGGDEQAGVDLAAAAGRLAMPGLAVLDPNLLN